MGLIFNKDFSSSTSPATEIGDEILYTNDFSIQYFSSFEVDFLKITGGLQVSLCQISSKFDYRFCRENITFSKVYYTFVFVLLVCTNIILNLSHHVKTIKIHNII